MSMARDSSIASGKLRAKRLDSACSLKFFSLNVSAEQKSFREPPMKVYASSPRSTRFLGNNSIFELLSSVFFNYTLALNSYGEIELGNSH